MSKHQRRKGNAQAASSAHAAELLTNSGHPLQIVTFGDCEPFTTTSLENRDADENFFDAEIQIALRKTTKRDLHTREKGLKELRRLIDEVAFDDVRKSFKHFAVLFPRLAFDTTVTVRSNVIRVLGDYIKKLKKNCEPYLEKVVSYVILMMHDSYSQVANESRSMLVDCFPNEKYGILIEMFKEPACVIALKFISGKHSLLLRCEEEETEEQRYVRLASQSLQYLHWFCTQSLSDEQRNRIIDFFNNRSYRRLLTSSSQIVSATMILASRVASLLNGWEVILNSALPTTALAHLDSIDRNVGRASALLILEMTKADVLFTVLDIDNVVVNRVISLIRRKKNFWNHISTIFIPVIKAVLDKKVAIEGQELLKRILSAFFDGMPWKLSFPCVAWVNTFAEFTEFGIWWTMNRCVNDLDIIVDEFIEKVWIAMKCTLNWNDKSLVKKMVHLPGRIISKWFRNSQIADRLRNQIQDHLLNELSSTGPLIEELFYDEVEPVWSHFIAQLLTHVHASQKLIYSVMEKCDDDILNKIASEIDLCQAISSKINWKDAEDAALLMLKLLIKFSAKFDKPITEFYKTNDELTSIRFLIAFGLLDKDRCFAAHFITDDLLLVRAMRFCVRQSDLKRWDILMDIATSFPDFDTALQQVLVENCYQIDQQLLITVLNKRGREISEHLRSKLVDLIVGQFFELQEPSAEVINETVKVMVSSNMDMKSVAQTISNKIKSTDLLQFDRSDIEIATTIATSLPSSSVTYFIISTADLVDKLSVLDKMYGLEIMDAQECLASPIIKSLFNENMDDNFTLLPHLGYAVFITSYLDMVLEQNMRYCTTSFLYAIAVSSLASINTVCNEKLIDTGANLKNLIKNLVLVNGQLVENIVSECISLIAKGNESLCLFITLRSLANSLCAEKVEALFKVSSENLDPYGITFCSAALRLQDTSLVCDDYCDPYISMKYWTSRFEITSSSENSVNLLQLFTQFMVEGRSTLEEYLFTYKMEDDEKQNIFNCAILRFLTRCCPYLRQMDTSMRDFLCCALITSLESANEFWGQCKSRSYLLFSSMSVKLFNEFAQMIDNTKDDVELAPFRQDWSDFFCPTAQNILLIWFFGLTSYQESSHLMALQNALCLSISYTTEEFIRTVPLPSVFDVELDLLNYDEHLQSVIIPLHTLINWPFPDVQIAALKILKLLTKDMLKIQNKQNEENNLGDEKLPSNYQKRLPVPFTRILDDTVIGNCILPPKLLIWDAFISSLSQFDLLERVAYCSAMGPYIDQIMPHLFSLLSDPHLCVNITVEVTDIAKRDYWNEIKSLLPRYAFRLFYSTCGILPAIVRQWYIKLPRAAATICKSFVTKSISQMIWKAECNQFTSREIPNKLKVRLLRAARQIVAEYDLEDSTMTLTIEYPVDYPLSIPLIEDERAIVSRETRRKWLLQLTMFLTHQNGSIVDAVLMWAGNIEKHMEGAEDCTICMMTVHSRTYQLPRVRCKQCKKRFHSDCLYKWFDSSNQSTCPLCRASFH
ncbi:Zinc finger protein 294., putative [Brugia malayi]|uniref:E3 ubiquitin-protein ligase listerin n=1 Tax=Brugia malayi TaxID=6279 RepID=A0A4E9FQJ0_BRUMA|nr:Zinc finger protein 294., putative [Brugia malayi]VIO98987.1 Zinc finger protein 294., putative [Brugia malayi]